MDSLIRHFDLSTADLSPADRPLVELCVSARGNDSIGLPTKTFSTTIPTNDFLIWIPNGLPSGNSVTVASSRLGKKLDQKGDWFDALRTLAVQMIEANKFLITAEKTTTDPFINRISELFNIPLVDFKRFPDQVNATWCDSQIQHKPSDGTRPLKYEAWYKPLDQSKTAKSEPGLKKAAGPPDANDLLLGIAQEAMLFSVRKSGNIFKAANDRLKFNRSQSSQTSTKLLMNRSLTPKSVEERLLQSGATAWWLYHNDFDPKPESKQVSVHSGSPPTLLNIDEIKTDQYLIHWTRRRVGPWPEQTQSEFLDDLIFQSSRREHSQLSSLCRILATRKVLGSNEIIRDRRPVVCFSSIPVEQLRQKRIFRPHLSRWDFELFGIAIDKELLKNLGAKPVIYGDESTWAGLAEHDRPWFQVDKTASGSIDWKSEREWRLLGDVNLEKVSHDQAFVFVPSESDAITIAKLTHWPTLILDQASQVPPK